VLARPIGVLLLAAGSLRDAAPQADTPTTYWLTPAPDGPAQAALRETLVRSAFGGPQAAVESLKGLSAQHSGTPTSGLAQLAAGLALLEADRPNEAIACLRHPDVYAHTALRDWALQGLGLALEAARDPVAAGAAYLQAADARSGSPVACPSLLRAGEALAKAGQASPAIAAFERALVACPRQEARGLLRIAQTYDGARQLQLAALTFDRLDREYPASPEALACGSRLKALAGYLPAEKAEERTRRALAKAQALLEAGRHRDALALWRALEKGSLTPEQGDLVHVGLGRCLVALKSTQSAEVQFAAVKAGSPHEAEAAYHAAKLKAARSSVDALESVATRFPGTPWGEQALLALANFYQKDARDADALPYYRRMLALYPAGQYGDRAAWRCAWGDIRAGRFDAAAPTLERAAVQHPATSYTAGFLYWAGRARRELGQIERARQLFEETVRRYKYSYHGMRAAQWLAALPRDAAEAPPALRSPAPDPRGDIAADGLVRIEQLLLIDRLQEALDELRSLPATPTAEATIAWIESRRGRLRPAISAMKRAYPGYRGEAGDLLPEDVWRILYPIEFRGLIEAKAVREGLDAALVAALICQESTFDPNAVSRAGARGLMQVMPLTGRGLARSLGVPYKQSALHDPDVSLNMGMRYLRQMLDRFGGRIERAVAAYNAGPHRVDAWTAGQPEIGAEEFIESIPFTETRGYVMTVLAGRENYRRVYSLAGAADATLRPSLP
jgi:soluble lytic murein transglycosylase